MKFQQRARKAEGWETLAQETAYEDGHLAVARVEVRSPARAKARRWTVVHRQAAVVIAALTPSGHLLLIREERVPIQAATWQVPAGQIDDGTEMAEVARRELREETGYRLTSDGKMTSLGHFFTSPGFTDECCHLFLAQPVEPDPAGAAQTESESILDCRAFPPAELAQMIARNEICDANTLSICAQLSARGLLSFSR